MPKCMTCGGEAGHVSLGRRGFNLYRRRQFCSDECGVIYRHKQGNVIAAQSLQEVIANMRLREEAREGCLVAQTTLRVRDGVRGLLSSAARGKFKTVEEALQHGMVRF